MKKLLRLDLVDQNLSSNVLVAETIQLKKTEENQTNLGNTKDGKNLNKNFVPASKFGCK